jgi:helix-turn-helix protein
MRGFDSFSPQIKSAQSAPRTEKFLVDIKDDSGIRIDVHSSEEGVFGLIANTAKSTQVQVEAIHKYTYGGEIKRMEVVFESGRLQLIERP